MAVRGSSGVGLVHIVAAEFDCRHTIAIARSRKQESHNAMRPRGKTALTGDTRINPPRPSAVPVGPPGQRSSPWETEKAREEGINTEGVVRHHAKDAHHRSAAVIALNVELAHLGLGIRVPGGAT
eukprot:scaffold77_cov116-Isochrysis_galbana.AAC.15